MAVFMTVGLTQNKNNSGIKPKMSFIIADTSDEAEGRGLRSLREDCPPQEGYLNYMVITSEVTKENLIKLSQSARTADEIKSKKL